MKKLDRSYYIYKEIVCLEKQGGKNEESYFTNYIFSIFSINYPCNRGLCGEYRLLLDDLCITDYNTLSDAEANTVYKAPTITFEKGESCVKLNWTSVDSAEKYGIVGWINNRWQLIDQCEDTSYVLNNLKAGNNYKVAVVTMIGNEWHKDFSNAITVTPLTSEVSKYPKVTNIKYSDKYPQFKLEWNAVDGATQYGIAVKLAGKWKVWTYTDETDFISPKLKAGSTTEMVICAKVNGEWDTSNINSRAFVVTIDTISEPPSDLIAPLGFKTADDAIKEIIQSDLSEIKGYAQMFERFQNDGFIYHFTDAENAITIREDHPNAAVWLMPYDYFEDTGILYHVEYQGKYYQVYYYFTDSAFPASNLWNYMEQRLHTENINIVDKKYGIVEHSNDGHPVVSAYFAIDDTHYCKVRTYEQEDALMDFLQVLNHNKRDIADIVPVNCSGTDSNKSAIAGKIFAYEKEGAGGYCTLSFNENGRFLYSPGKLSSYMDGGDWKIDEDTVSLIGMENKTIYLKITDDTLVYIAEDSDEFPYMDIKDGEKFNIYRPEISSDKFQLNSRYSEYGLGDPKIELDLIASELPELCYVEDVRLYDEDDNFIGMMSPAMDADIWSYLVDCHVTEECSKTYYTLSKIRCGGKTYLDDVRSEITVNFK